MMKKYFLRGAVLLFFLAGPGRGEEILRKASLIPLWSPQAQFAGYYVALEKGIFKKHGLDVSFIQGGVNNPPLELLKTGRADFGVMWLSSGIRGRARGTPLVNIAQMTQRSGLVLVARKSSGLRNPQDLNGKKISFWGGDLEIQPRAFIEKYRLNVTTVPQGYSVNLFLRGGVDAAAVMWYNEYHTLLNSGLDENELTTFFFDQYGLNFPEDGIYAMEDTVVRSPELCASFVTASLEGWAYAFSHEDETLEIVLKYMREAGLPANRIHQKWMLEKMKALTAGDGSANVTGALAAEDYARVSSALVKYGAIKAAPDFHRFHKPAVNK